MECINSLDEIRIAREGLQSARFIAAEEEAQIILLGIEKSKLPPGQVVLQVVPHPFDRVHLGAIGGQEEQTDILREGKLGRGVRPTVVQQENVEAVRKGLGKGIEEELEHLSVQIVHIHHRPPQLRPSVYHLLGITKPMH
jgi:hypothetical protein